MTQVTNTPYEALEVGQTASYSKTVGERDIQLFAAMSGDHNPVHLDPEFAAATMFKERIAHGMFSGALISAAVACELPGPGTIYVGQQMSFQKPVKIGDTPPCAWKFWKNCPSSAYALLLAYSTSATKSWLMARLKSLPHANSKP